MSGSIKTMVLSKEHSVEYIPWLAARQQPKGCSQLVPIYNPYPVAKVP